MGSLRQYIVTVADRAHLDDIYNELETEGIAPSATSITRAVECNLRRPNSRNTEYLLTDGEAAQLREDPRILAVELRPSELGMVAKPFVRQYSERWDRIYQDASIDSLTGRRNWGLLRTHQQVGLKTWGDYGDANTWFKESYIDMPYIGRNVDVVIVDGYGAAPNHPEFAVNEDGTGGSRFVPYNWYQHNPAVLGTEPGTYTYPANGDSHGTHVAGTALGQHHGFARGANYYHIGYDAPAPVGASGQSDQYVYDYIREFHLNKPINPLTGRKNPTVVNSSWGYSWNYFIGFQSFAKVIYRGEEYPAVSGLSGVFDEKDRLLRFTNKVPQNTTEVVATSNANTSVYAAPTRALSTITYATHGVTPLVGSSANFTPGLGNYWNLDLPHPVYFRGQAYSRICVAAQGALVFGDANQVPFISDNANVLRPWVFYAPKIFVTATPLTTTTGARVMVDYNPTTYEYLIKVETTTNNTSFTTTFEFILDLDPSNTPSSTSEIIVNIGPNGKVGFMDYTAKTDFGMVHKGGQFQGFGSHVPSIDADVEDMIDAGVIHIGAAGNYSYLIDKPGGIDFNNCFVTSGNVAYYHNQGSTPTASTPTLNNITVGAIGVPSSYLEEATGFSDPVPNTSPMSDTKASFSECGPGVDIYAPGLNITSAYVNTNIAIVGWPDERNPSYSLGKLNGTSMASPHVTGVVACMLEHSPSLTQADVKRILKDTAIQGEMVDGTMGEVWWYGIQGGENKILRYSTPQRPAGQDFPEATDAAGRASNEGQLYPRNSTLFLKPLS